MAELECDGCVAVPPRSPIGYNLARFGTLTERLRFPPDLPSGIIIIPLYSVEVWLRFPPDLPSGIIRRIKLCLACSCGSPPISHRV